MTVARKEGDRHHLINDDLEVARCKLWECGELSFSKFQALLLGLRSSFLVVPLNQNRKRNLTV